MNMSQADEQYSNVQVYTGMPAPQDNDGFFQPPAPTAGAGHALAAVDEFRAIAEVQASMMAAKRFPRNEHASFARIMTACKRKSLAENAAYAYPRGNTTVTGPSIRRAEVLANAWGTIDYGYREDGSGPGYTDVEAYAFDKESNSRSCRTFRIQHIRSTKQGNKKLTDPRDIYEMVANQASRRIRACILQIIPGDVTDEAIKACEATIKKSGGDAPLVDRVRKMAVVFQELGVTTEMIERRLGHKLDASIEQELVQLRRIYTSIKDGAAKREEFFDLAAAPQAAPAATAAPAPHAPPMDPAPAAPATTPPAAPTKGKGKATAAPAEKPASEPAAPLQSAPPASTPPAHQGPGLSHDPQTGEVFGAAPAENPWAIRCPKTGKDVDELDCPSKSCHQGCPAFAS
jgi:hypothetical protein